MINSMPTPIGTPSVHQHGEVSSLPYPWQSFYSSAMPPFPLSSSVLPYGSPYGSPMNCSLSSASSHWYHPSATTVLTPTNTGKDNLVFFGLKHLGGTHICICYGCGSAIRMDVSQLPAPPHDIVISYKERRYFKDPITKETRLTSSNENTYHMMLKSVQLKHLSFRALLCGLAMIFFLSWDLFIILIFKNSLELLFEQ